MATHSSILAWTISWTEEPGGLVFDQLRYSCYSDQTHSSLNPDLKRNKNTNPY